MHISIKYFIDKLIEDIRESNVTVEAEKEKNKNLLKNIDDLQVLTINFTF